MQFTNYFRHSIENRSKTLLRTLKLSAFLAKSDVEVRGHFTTLTKIAIPLITCTSGHN